MELPAIRSLRFLLLPLLIFAAPRLLHSQIRPSQQGGELHGEVDQPDGTPYRDGALVKIEDDRGGMAAEVRTDSGGRFDVGGLQSSRYTVTVHAQGFRDTTAEADLTTILRANLRINLRALPPDAHTESSREAAPAILSVNDLNVPEPARAEFEKGRVLLVEKHKSADSVKPLQKAVQLAPSFSQAHFLLGTAYMDLGKLSDSESELTKATTYNEKFASAYLELGSCLLEEKKFAEAEKPLSRGLELFPDASQGHYDLGRDYYTLNRFPEAETQARKALELQPEFAEAHLLLGNVLLRLRNGPGALTEFQSYLRLAPNGPFAGAATELVKKLEAALPGSQ